MQLELAAPGVTQSFGTLSFFVPGVPRPGGSKRFVGRSKTGHAILIDDCARNKDWRAVVALAGREAMQREGLTTLINAPLEVSFTFQMPRPKYHFNKRGLRSSAPSCHSTKPDVLKLARSTEDALSGVIWSDDSLTSELRLSKRYTDSGDCGCLVTVRVTA